ncbi:MAG: indolepyruvate ferredoxin oxidoreductase family protein, partial [Nitratireductor sp.]|nr:indolepyruvate ferredoxin oxidoreductase family protein [Nitratireductor sp.]
QLFNWRADVRPRIVGKFDHKDRHLLSLHEEITAGVATRIIATRLLDYDLPEGLRKNLKKKLEYYNDRHELRLSHKTPVNRVAHFCAGCPHNTSTKVPDGSRAFAGIGCHFMALWMDRNTETYTHMGGEGVTWAGIAPFTDEKHVFANLGDGTYFHSGIMAIRQSVASGANITYKLLYNDAVAMTGGQKIDGSLTVPELAAQLQAEGVRKLWLVSDEPEKYSGVSLPAGITIKHRDWLDDVQQEARETEGCTAIIYDQTCATEKRRRRKRGTMADPDKRAFINPLVCEGCGDCSVQSNCISIEPLETEFGRKRQINQSSCNKDFSCVKGFCPSFVTVQGASLKKRQLPALADESLPEPEIVPLEDDVYNIAITGVGGTGVLTIGAIIGMAAHIDGKAAMIQDFSGLAQKGGAVLSHIRLSKTTDLVAAAQIPPGEADLLIAADTVVASDKGPIALYATNRTKGILNTHLTPVSSFVFDRDFDFRETSVINTISKGIRENPDKVDFTRLAELVCGDSIATNIMMLGYASQKGTLPIGVNALEKAIELNGVAIKANKLAFNWGRRFAEKPDEMFKLLAEAHSLPEEPETLEQLIDRRAEFLTAYQDAAYAKRYRDLVAKAEAAEAKLGTKRDLTNAVARYFFKLMAYKDEYEVARLFTDGDFKQRLGETFDGDLKLTFHLAPPIFKGRTLPNGRPAKREFGPWMFTAMKWLAKMKRLRGTAFDPFGRSEERRTERRLITDYEAMIGDLAADLSNRNHRFAVALARIPDEIRGYGPVKEKSVEKAEKNKAALLAQFANPPAEVKAEKLEAAE